MSRQTRAAENVAEYCDASTFNLLPLNYRVNQLGMQTAQILCQSGAQSTRTEHNLEDENRQNGIRIKVEGWAAS